MPLQRYFMLGSLTTVRLIPVGWHNSQTVSSLVWIPKGLLSGLIS